MEMSQNKTLNLIFKIAVTVILAGIFFYLLQEMISAFPLGEAYTVFIGIADLIGMATVVTFIVRLYLSEKDLLLMNIEIILGAVYVFFYIFSHFMASLYQF